MPKTGSSSPRTRGYFRRPDLVASWRNLFPAHAGVFPIGSVCRTVSGTLPRARGGISCVECATLCGVVSSPRTRGYFHRCDAARLDHPLFPAHAGVFPGPGLYTGGRGALPRARGGISAIRLPYNPEVSSSPRTRGYFPREEPIEPNPSLFPAHAGVFPT